MRGAALLLLAQAMRMELQAITTRCAEQQAAAGVAVRELEQAREAAQQAEHELFKQRQAAIEAVEQENQARAAVAAVAAANHTSPAATEAHTADVSPPTEPDVALKSTATAAAAAVVLAPARNVSERHFAQQHAVHIRAR